MCPKGDDPLTIDQDYRKFSLTVYAGDGYFSGTIGVQFMGGSVILSLTSPSTAECIEAFENSLLFGYVNCEYLAHSSSEWQYTITVYSWPTYPHENNLHSHDGNPAITNFYCDTSNTNSGVYCVFEDIVSSNIRGEHYYLFIYKDHRQHIVTSLTSCVEYEYCSLRGKCDFATGLCDCDSGFGGPACSNLTYTYTSGSSALPGLEVLVNEIDYVGSALQIVSKKSSASDFYFLEAIANQEQMFSVRGDGLVGIRKLLTITGGHTIAGGGLYVLSGGCTILNAPLSVYTSDEGYNEAARFHSKSTASLNSSYAVMKISSSSTSSSHYLFTAKNQETTRFAIRADGSTFIHAGGLSITGGLTVQDIGMRVKYGGITVERGGLRVTNDGITVSNSGIRVSSGVTINSGGLKVLLGGMQLYAGGMSIYSGGLKISGGGLSMTSAGIAVTGGLTVNTRGIRVTGGLTVFSAGAMITGGKLLSYFRSLHLISHTTIVADLSVSGSVYGASMLSVSSLYVGTGGMTVEGSLSASTPYVVITSDRRLKTHIEAVPDAMKKISKLRGVYYNWVKDTEALESIGMNYDDSRHVGLIAQDVQEAIPEAVATVGGDRKHGKYLGIDYSAIVPVLINAMNEIEDRVRNKSIVVDNKTKQDEACNRRIEILEDKVTSMEAEITELKQLVHQLLRRS
jgi:hypothetical protein